MSFNVNLANLANIYNQYIEIQELSLTCTSYTRITKSMIVQVVVK